MRTYCVYSQAQVGSYLTYHDHVIAGLQRAGAIAVEERTFCTQAGLPAPDDRVIGVFLSDGFGPIVYGSVPPEHRWCYLVDTKVRPDGTGAYEGRIQQFQRLGIRNVLITYPSQRDTQRLLDAGLRVEVMPCSVPARRTRIPKPLGVVMTGTFDADFYPTRYRLGELFRRELPGIAGLPVPKGWSDPIGKLTAPKLAGEDYYRMLDECQLGVVCRAGIRDYMVGKYVEYGMCHVLPVGDCPSYMPEEMKRAMVDAEGMPDAAVVAEVKRLLSSPAELRARQDAYAAATHLHYDLLTNARRVMTSITSG